MKKKDFYGKKISKNCLTKGTPSVIIVKLARAKAKGKSEANLENDTEKKRANIKERLAKIPKSEKHRKMFRIKRKSLILAQDERWRRA